MRLCFEERAVMQMFDTVLTSVITALVGEDIPAVRAFPAEGIDRDSTAVAVFIKGGSITASGYGDYLGIAEENGVTKEYYGSHGEIKIGLSIYAPADSEEDITELLGDICACIGSVSGVKLKSFEQGEVKFDTETEMLKCESILTVSAYLIRDSAQGSSFTDFVLKGELK